MAAILMHEAATIEPKISESVRYNSGGSEEKSVIVAQSDGFFAQSITIQIDSIKYTVTKGFRRKGKFFLLSKFLTFLEF